MWVWNSTNYTGCKIVTSVKRKTEANTYKPSEKCHDHSTVVHWPIKKSKVTHLKASGHKLYPLDHYLDLSFAVIHEWCLLFSVLPTVADAKSSSSMNKRWPHNRHACRSLHAQNFKGSWQAVLTAVPYIFLFFRLVITIKNAPWTTTIKSSFSTTPCYRHGV